MFNRRTKIIATLGPATDTPGVLDALVAAGMDCARLNCSHGTQEDLRRRAGEVRAAAERAGRPLGLLFDLQGPKLRLSAVVVPRTVQAGEVVTFTCTDDDVRGRACSGGFPGLPTTRHRALRDRRRRRCAASGGRVGGAWGGRRQVDVGGRARSPQGDQRHVRAAGAAGDHGQGLGRSRVGGGHGRGFRRPFVCPLGG